MYETLENIWAIELLVDMGLNSSSSKFLLKMGTIIQIHLAGLLWRLDILFVKCFYSACLLWALHKQFLLIVLGLSLSINTCLQKEWMMNALYSQSVKWLAQLYREGLICYTVPTKAGCSQLKNVKVDIPPFERRGNCISGSLTTNPLNHLGRLLKIHSWAPKST